MTAPMHGWMQVAPLLSVLFAAALLSVLWYRGESPWATVAVVALWGYGLGAPLVALVVLGGVAVVLLVPSVRRRLVSGPLMKAVRAAGVMPTISETERTALEAGDLWVERDLFSGAPDWDRILRQPAPRLTEEERAFLEGPVEEVCERVRDWEVWKRRKLPEDVWSFLKQHRFLGMIIPEEYGGLGFSTYAHSSVIQKLASHCQSLAINVMVPNSLGPAELLMHYGTEDQKEYYLPRLARGEEIPCFALTETGAGSDAGALASEGTVFRDEDGELKLRLNWSKRYITLAPIATVVGLAFRLRDPENHLGKGPEPGITCALVPVDREGVETGRRHDPMGVPFPNGPTRGNDVVVPLDVIIGGPERAGDGWAMLMESLGVGRGVSLPASSAGASKLALRVTSAHGRIRRQFGIPIGKFEGIGEILARSAGFNYLMEAGRRYTCSALDQGSKPPVVTAMVKYSFTELGRTILGDAMDVRAGNAIQRGPRNLLAHPYIAAPISLTVEGANVMTRSLIIFGQGAVRCHPYLYSEFRAIREGDREAFDRAFFGHIGHVWRNAVRALILSLTRGRAARPDVDGVDRRHLQKLSWASSSFALLADVALGTLGGALKKKEAVSGRFADVFRWMYLASATLWYRRVRGGPEEDDLVEWVLSHALSRMQEAFQGLYRNLRVPGFTWLLRGPLKWWGRINAFAQAPPDELEQDLAGAIQRPGGLRETLTQGIYTTDDPTRALGRLDETLRRVVEAQKLEDRVRDAVDQGSVEEASQWEQTLRRAREHGVIDEAEERLLVRARQARREAVQVDDFALETYLRHFQDPALV